MCRKFEVFFEPAEDFFEKLAEGLPRLSQIHVGKLLGIGNFGVVFSGKWRNYVKVAMKRLSSAKMGGNFTIHFKTEKDIT